MKHSPFKSRDRGAILIVALILAVLSGVAVASYMRLGKTTMQLSDRAFYANAAVNLAETGLEQAMWSINQGVAGNSDAWSSWTLSGTKATRTFTGTDFGANTTGQVKVVIEGYTGTSAPVVYTMSTITPPSGAPINKWLKVELAKRGRFANGLVAKDRIVFNGNNVKVDSWNSDPDKNDATAAIPYGAGVRRDNGTVASAAIYVNSVLINNADVWGYAATGGAQPQVGNNGSILGADSAAAGYTQIDPRRVSTDFTATFDILDYVGPAPVSRAAITSDETISVSGSITYSLPEISLNSKKLVIESGDVTLIITGSNAISITGNSSAGIDIKPGASLTIYTAGDVKIAGNGVANYTNQPKAFQLYGTKAAGGSLQDVDISGNGVLSAVVYAPNADIDLNGGGTNGQVAGSMVGTNITLVGNSNFHYDESLADLDTGNPFGIKLWSELSLAAEREAAASHLN